MSEIITEGQHATDASPTLWRKKWQHLKEIEKTLVMRKQGMTGPRASFAFLTGGGIVAGLMTIFIGIEQFGQHIPSVIFNLVPLSASFVCFILILWRSKRPKTWTEELDQQLLAYNPINKDAYRQLQQKTMEIGYLDTHQVCEWLSLERKAIDVASGWRQASPDGFLSKTV